MRKAIGTRNMLKLSSTSALVLLWAGDECYQTKKARNYLSRLDLEDGKLLYERCKEVCPYYDEVIKNRKFGVFQLIRKCFAEGKGKRQLVIAGAGLDACGIEATELYPRVNVFELDKENMDIKSRLTSNTADESNGPNGNIAFIEVDLSNAGEVYRGLSAHGWAPAKPTLLILEGISYYLPAESIRKLVQVINPTWIILEFLKKDEEIAAERVNVPRQIFGLISSLCGLSYIAQYSYLQLEELFKNLSVLEKYGMKRLEGMRTGANGFFPTENSGWIEVCLLVNRQAKG